MINTLKNERKNYFKKWLIKLILKFFSCFIFYANWDAKRFKKKNVIIARFFNVYLKINIISN